MMDAAPLMDADVIVVGGGLAGLACALGLAGSDLSITVLERADRLGGRAASFVDATTGDVVDTGPHVVHSHGDNLLAFARWAAPRGLDGVLQRTCGRIQSARIVCINTGFRGDIRVCALPFHRHSSGGLQMMKKLIAVGFAAVMAAGCSTWDSMSRSEKGTVVGGAAGAAVGNAVVGGPLGTIGGAAAGGVIGHEVGKRQDQKR